MLAVKVDNLHSLAEKVKLVEHGTPFLPLVHGVQGDRVTQSVHS